MPTITLEEHYASPGFLDGPGRDLKAQALKFGAAAERLSEDGPVGKMDGYELILHCGALRAPYQAD